MSGESLLRGSRGINAHADESDELPKWITDPKSAFQLAVFCQLISDTIHGDLERSGQLLTTFGTWFEPRVDFASFFRDSRYGHQNLHSRLTRHSSSRQTHDRAAIGPIRSLIFCP